MSPSGVFTSQLITDRKQLEPVAKNIPTRKSNASQSIIKPSPKIIMKPPDRITVKEELIEVKKETHVASEEGEREGIGAPTISNSIGTVMIKNEESGLSATGDEQDHKLSRGSSLSVTRDEQDHKLSRDSSLSVTRDQLNIGSSSSATQKPQDHQPSGSRSKKNVSKPYMFRYSTVERQIGVKDFSCQHCENNYNSLGELKTHIKAQHSQFNCDHCWISCTSPCALNTHITTHHPDVEQISCDVCEYTCFDAALLRHHTKNHEGDKGSKPHSENEHTVKRLICKICDSRHATMEGLITHMRRHEISSVCEFCGYRAEDLRRMGAHRRKHVGERIFNCQRCNFGCSSKSDLLIHNAGNCRGKLYKCELCDFESNTWAPLKSHLGIHLGGKIYTCRFCQSIFSQSSALRRHTRSKHSSNKI
ncbi:zinc finger protein 34-like isoform X2 [Nilaparvata lugens]|uniref:zinc finger protein 34-like isoform X2 n=1 Tax=Nilaparvata lugens TaxID=108931 RepID=UPI00193D16DE|nr:zinc finger protein 34-like isoform X2 [Nilaparvata lugens]